MSNKSQLPEVPLDQLVELRREVLHKFPELSGKETETAKAIVDFLKPYDPDEIITEIGGHGVACIFHGSKKEGPTVMVRCELDALAIHEDTDLDHQSENAGVSHKCGHDGHMAIVCGLAALFQNNPPKTGKVVLMFQPSEENGMGAEAVIADPKFENMKPDWVFAMHNIPGHPLNQVIVKDGRFNPAVISMIVKFTGCTSHAGEPDKGRNPAMAMAELVNEMCGWTDSSEDADAFTIITPVYQSMGEKAYGVSAGEGEVHFTLRCDTSGKMKALEERAEKLAHEIAEKHELEVDTDWLEEFYSSHNDAEANDFIRAAVKDLDFDLYEAEHPFKWGEDFGMFTHHFKGAMFCIGSGEDHPALHHPDYDFPDEMIETGVRVFFGTVNRILNV